MPASRHELTVDEPPEQPQADQVDAMLDTWIMAEALDRLTPEHREVIVECYYRGSLHRRGRRGAAASPSGRSSHARTTRSAR